MTDSAPDPVLSVVKERDNGSLIAQAARLYIKPTDTVLDMTWGRGKWWTKYQHPGPFIKHDLYTLDGVDFRDLPEPDNSIDVVAYDPPYTLQGGRETSTVKDMLNRYGQDTVPSSIAELTHLIYGGIIEAHRVVKPRGFVFFKCMDFVSSGRYWPVHVEFVRMADNCGLYVADEFVHVTGTGPQPKTNLDGSPRRQVHSRRAHSFLNVLQKP